MRRARKILFIVFGIAVLAAAAWGATWWHAKEAAAAALAAQYQTPQEASDVFVRFDMEAYDAIKTNYWQAASDADLAQLFLLSAQKATGSSTLALATTTRAAAASMLDDAFKQATSTDEERSWALETLEVALYNLAPAGRDELLSQGQETQLRNEVSNVNPTKDLYGDLGLSKGASTAQVNSAYQSQVATLQASTSPQAQQELQQVTYAHDVLTNPESKTLYDTAQVEPTVFGHIIGSTLYIYLEQIAPTTLQEFAYAVDQASTTPGLTSMIIDVRGNIGGDLSFAQAFLGLFIGQNQYVFDLYHQGTDEPERTTQPQFSELARYKNIVLLADNMTQSTAELTTAALKRYHLVTVVGTQTRGWGSVENTYPLTTVIDPSTTYALLLVNSLTLGDTEEPIEQNGVTPDININDTNWKSEAAAALGSGSLLSAVEQMVSQGTWKF